MSKPRGQRAPRRSDKYGFELPATSQQVLPVGRLCSTDGQRGMMTGNGQTRVWIFSLTVLLAIGVVTPNAYAACGNIGGQPARQVFSNGSALATCLDGDNWTSISTSGTPGGSTGHVQFNNEGVFAGDAGLFWDNTNKRLGIGTATPAAYGHILVSGTSLSNGDFVVQDSAGSGNSATIGLVSNSTDGASTIFFGAPGALFNGSVQYNHQSDFLRFHTAGSGAGTERMRISAGGNVGIGTAGPSKRLTVQTSANASTDGISVNSPDLTYIQLLPDMSAGALNGLTQAGDSGLIFSNNAIDTGNLVIGPWGTGNKGMRITSVGNVGIGTPSPSEKLSVNSGSTPNGQMAFSFVDNEQPSSLSTLAAGWGGALTYNMSGGQSEFNFVNRASSASPGIQGFSFIQQTGTGTFDTLVTISGDTGNVGIGTTSPTNKLDVAGDIGVQGSGLFDLEVVRVAGSGGTGQQDAVCPAGKNLISGGCQSSGVPFDFNYPVNSTTWRCRGYPSSGAVTPYAVCGKVKW